VRACRCALWLAAQLQDMCERLGAELGSTPAIGLGLHSGRVVLASGEAASGPLVERAADLAADAAPRRIRVSEETHRAVRELFRVELEPRTPASPPGHYLLEPSSIHVETRFDAAAVRGLQPRVGRQCELGALHAALRELPRSGGRVVAVVGDAGIGKSRLCHDFAQDVRASGGAVDRVVCPSHARTLPLAPVLALARSLLGMEPDAPRADIERALAAALERAPDDAGEAARLLLELLSADARTDPPAQPSLAQQDLVFALLRTWLGVAQGAARGIVIVEDVQWMDAASQRFLAGLVGAVRAVRRLVVVSFRPDHLPPWLASPCVDRIVLRPLGRGECEALVRALLGGEASEDELVRRIAQRAGGKPFDAEEIVQELVDVGKLSGEPGAYRTCGPIDDLGLPPRVEDMVAARIDRLPPARRRILHAAAALDAEVPEQLLAALSGAPSDELSTSLCELQWLDLLFEVHHGLERCFQVKHAIVREVAYQSLLREAGEPDVAASCARQAKRAASDGQGGGSRSSRASPRATEREQAGQRGGRPRHPADRRESPVCSDRAGA
jgi:adenylate cyclase